MKFDLQIFELGTTGTRKKIIRLLKENDGLYYGDIIRSLGGDPHTVIQALIDLKNKGIVSKCEPDGKYYLTR